MLLIERLFIALVRQKERYRRWQAGDTVVIDGLVLHLDARISDAIAMRMVDGVYDCFDRHLIKTYLRRGDFVLELGTGSGLTAMTAKRQVGAAGDVTTVEPDLEMYLIAKKNFALNQCVIVAHHGAAVPQPDLATVKLFRRENFVDSGLVGSDLEASKQVEVAAIYPGALIPRCRRRKVLICDVEGAETELLSDREILRPFSLVIVEVHNYGVPQKAHPRRIGLMMMSLVSMGFIVAESFGHTWVFLREQGEGDAS